MLNNFLKSSIIRPIANFFCILILKLFTPTKASFKASIAREAFLQLLKLRLPRVNLRNGRIGSGVTLAEGVTMFERPILYGKVSINRYTSISGPATRIFSTIDPITIGSFCSIASGVVIQGHYHNSKRATSYNIFSNVFQMDDFENQNISKGPITIEDDVWIGSNAVILSGVRIGRGAIIGAGAIVTKDIDCYTVVAGNPAVKIKDRFTSLTKMRLEDSKWWMWPVEKIIKEIDFFCQERV